MPTTPASLIRVKVKKRQARFRRVRVPGARDQGIGEFFLLLDITAVGTPAFIPLSVASGKKPAGFVYQIEGTAEGQIATTDIAVSGAGVTQITSGTILYAKIPDGKTATFRILITMRGKTGKEYGVIISTINYKGDPNDARYKKYLEPLQSARAKFR